MDVLVRKARAGDPASREELARVWLGPVYAAALAATRRPADAEDLAQETFLRAFRALGGLRKPARFGPWLLRILHNARRDLARRPAAPGHAGDEVLGVEARTGSQEDADDVVQAWRALPEVERLVFWLKVVDGRTVRQIADLVGHSKSAVDRAFRRALARMRAEVESHADL